MRRLVLMRHAKSDWPDGVDDHVRPLAERGRRDAPAAGAWIRDNVGEIDSVRVSSARRAGETWGLVAARLQVGDDVRVDPRLYDTDEDGMLAVIREVSPHTRTLVVVAHNPTTQDLAAALAGQAEPDAAARMATKFPTAGIAVLSSETPWADLGRDTMRLEAFAVPRG
jgi:phosphohistidine phosphatase